MVNDRGEDVAERVEGNSGFGDRRPRKGITGTMLQLTRCFRKGLRKAGSIPAIAAYQAEGEMYITAA